MGLTMATPTTPTTAYSTESVQQRLDNDDALAGWRLHEGQLKQSFTFATFPQAMGFVNRIAAAAESVQHHPEIDIRFSKVFIKLSTHEPAGITQKDFDLAVKIDTLVRPTIARAGSVAE